MASDDRGRSGGMGAAAFGAYRLCRKISRLPFFNALIPGRLRVGVQRRMLSGVLDRLPDRRYLEETILPAVALLRPGRLLDVGVQDYSRHHDRWFPPDCEYWTLDLDPAAARHRPSGRHVVGNVLDVASYFEPGSLDVVLLNGVFGFGIDLLGEQERTIEAAREVLRPGGRLLVGWNRAGDGRAIVMDERPGAGARIEDPLELESIRALFAHEPPPGLPARIGFADSSHAYDWFRAR